VRTARMRIPQDRTIRWSKDQKNLLVYDLKRYHVNADSRMLRRTGNR
jgi:hypothetical protein